MDTDRIKKIVILSIFNILIIALINYIIENASLIFGGGNISEITAHWFSKISSLTYLGVWVCISIFFAFYRTRQIN